MACHIGAMLEQMKVRRGSGGHRRENIYFLLNGETRRYGLLLAPAEGFGRGFFCTSGKKRAYYDVLAHFWPFLVSSSNLGNF